MKLSFFVQRRDDELTVSKSGDTLTINGDELNFSALPEGATLPASAIHCEWVLGSVTRMDGHVDLTLILPAPAGASLERPTQLVDPEDGVLTLPIPPVPVSPTVSIPEGMSHG